MNEGNMRFANMYAESITEVETGLLNDYIAVSFSYLTPTRSNPEKTAEIVGSLPCRRCLIRWEVMRKGEEKG